MNIAERFSESFGLELTDENINYISTLPIKKVDGLFRDIANWKKYQTKPINKLEDIGLTLIYLKMYNMFSEKRV